MFTEALDTYNDIAPFLLIVGVVLFIYGINREGAIKKILSHGQKTIGKVIELRQDPTKSLSNQSNIGLAPVVEYSTVSGNTLQHVSTTYREPCRYTKGESVDIWYINYKSIREAALIDDVPGQTPKKIRIIGFLLLLAGTPRLAIQLLYLL